MHVRDVMALFETEQSRIWLESPEEITRLGRGEAARPTGSRHQYLTPIMFAESSIRSFTDEVLWGTLALCRRPGLDFATLVEMTCEQARRKSEFCAFVDLQHVSKMIDVYIDGSRRCSDVGQYEELTRAALSYFNRVHVWIDAAFPWTICNQFKRTTSLRPARVS